MIAKGIAAALFSAFIIFTVICTIVGGVALAIGGFIVWVADRELRQSRKSRKGRK